MKYDFDSIVERRGTNSLKYDFTRAYGKNESVIPLWVADMDFKTAPEITERLKKIVEHGIFGYSDGNKDYFEAVAGWYQRRFGWKVEQDWLIKTPGIVFAIAMAVRAYTKEGDAVLIQQPVYYPFSHAIIDNKRKCINSPLVFSNGRYEINFEDFEKKIVEQKVKLFILCSPHNPVGRVWEVGELKKLADICMRHGVTIVSDEIHSDFTYTGHTHHVLASLAPEYEKITVTCTAPSKTFNLAGLQISNIFIPNKDLRNRFQQEIMSAGYSQVNLMGIIACQAAYEEGEYWVDELKCYLEENLSFVRTFLKEKLPEIKLIEPEGTYLIWLDFGALNLTEEEREKFLSERAQLWLDSGAIFGKDGEGFERINIACPRAVLEKAFRQLEQAVHSSNSTGQ